MQARADRIFRHGRRKLLRRHIPFSENVASVSLAVAVVALVVWVLGQRDDFDAGSRDLAPELMVRDAPPLELYTPPLKPWVEPGAAGTGAGVVDLGLFPGAVADAEWRVVGRVRSFVADNLYEKINGEAEKFLGQGFVALDYLVLRSAAGGAEIAIELYDQGDVSGSMGVFADHVSAEREVRAADGVTYFRTSVGLIGRKGRYFFRAAGDRQSAGVEAKAEQLVSAFAGLSGTDGTLAEGMKALGEALALPESRISHQASNVFQFDFASDFWFGRLGEGDGAGRAFVHVAADADAARALFALLVEEQAYDYEVLNAEDVSAFMRHQVLSTYFAVERRGRVLYGVEQAPDRGAVGDVMQAFARRYADEQEEG